jgi:hypothetical protein
MSSHITTYVTETGSVCEMVMYLSHLSQLSAREHIIEFCYHEIFKISVIYTFVR